MGVFLNFVTAGATAQVAAGFNSVPPADGAVKTYQVYVPAKSEPSADYYGGHALAPVRR